jgi:hypothetical protein
MKRTSIRLRVLASRVSVTRPIALPFFFTSFSLPLFQWPLARPLPLRVRGSAAITRWRPPRTRPTSKAPETTVSAKWAGDEAMPLGCCRRRSSNEARDGTLPLGAAGAALDRRKAAVRAQEASGDRSVGRRQQEEEARNMRGS